MVVTDYQYWTATFAISIVFASLTLIKEEIYNGSPKEESNGNEGKSEEAKRES